MNPKVDAFLSNAKKWQEEFDKLRMIILDCQLTEERGARFGAQAIKKDRRRKEKKHAKGADRSQPRCNCPGFSYLIATGLTIIADPQVIRAM
jgi:hypothetical protein